MAAGGVALSRGLHLRSPGVGEVGTRSWQDGGVSGSSISCSSAAGSTGASSPKPPTGNGRASLGSDALHPGGAVSPSRTSRSEPTSMANSRRKGGVALFHASSGGAAGEGKASTAATSKRARGGVALSCSAAAVWVALPRAQGLAGSTRASAASSRLAQPGGVALSRAQGRVGATENVAASTPRAQPGGVALSEGGFDGAVTADRAWGGVALFAPRGG